MNRPTTIADVRDLLGSELASTSRRLRRVGRGRLALTALGLLLCLFGLYQVLVQSLTAIVWTVAWGGVAVVVHDGILAPGLIIAAWVLRRVLPRRAWAALVVAGAISGTLLLISLPVLFRRGHIADNPTVLNRNYPLGLVVALLISWFVVAGVATVVVARRRRTGHGLPE